MQQIPTTWTWLVLTVAAPAALARPQTEFDAPPPSPGPHVLAPVPMTPTSAPAVLPGSGRPAILLTGYWPPSNEGVRRFSANPAQNPLGWIGSNWEGRGYDVYSYFPEFSPPTCTSCGTGAGDLEVDYQDTSADFWTIANALQPIAILTFSRTNADFSWEVEQNTYNFQTWSNDYVSPVQPTPAPPDASVPAGTLRTSTLPMQAIVDGVNGAGLGLNGFICTAVHSGSFVSGFIAYHGTWYQSLHSNPLDPAWCVAAGHVHVGDTISWPVAQAATEITLRTVIRRVDQVRGFPGEVFCQGDGVDPTHTTACPCGNVGAAGNGCANSGNPAGANLLATGATNPDALTLAASGMPATSACIYLQGDALEDVVFGDGVRCSGGNLIRLRTKPNAGGASQFPEPGDPSVSTRGLVTPGSGARRYYQTYYRNAAAAFCPPETF
ncbi:MAG: hypothetical protein U1F29_09775, partial [Planctomycetota bacterium]